MEGRRIGPLIEGRGGAAMAAACVEENKLDTSHGRASVAHGIRAGVSALLKDGYRCPMSYKSNVIKLLRGSHRRVTQARYNFFMRCDLHVHSYFSGPAQALEWERFAANAIASRRICT